VSGAEVDVEDVEGACAVEVEIPRRWKGGGAAATAVSFQGD